MRPVAAIVGVMMVAACGSTEPTFRGETGRTNATSMAAAPDGRFVLGGVSVVSMHAHEGGEVWRWPIEEAADVEIYDVEVDSGGRILVWGSFRGELAWGGGTLTPSEDSFDDYFIALLDEVGAAEMARAIAPRPDSAAGGVAIDPDGNAVVVGTFAGAIDLGDQRLEAVQEIGTFAARVTSDDGDVLAASLVASDAWAKDVVVDQEGAVYVLVNSGSEGGVDFGDDQHLDGPYRSFIARHTVGVGTGWAKRIDAEGSVMTSPVASFERGVAVAVECVTRFEPTGDVSWNYCPDMGVHDLAADRHTGGLVVVGTDSVREGNSTGDPYYFYRKVIGFDAFGAPIWGYEDDVSRFSSQLVVGAVDPNGTVLTVASDGDLLVFER